MREGERERVNERMNVGVWQVKWIGERVAASVGMAVRDKALMAPQSIIQ